MLFKIIIDDDDACMPHLGYWEDITRLFVGSVI
jgi:hypothetical protein